MWVCHTYERESLCSMYLIAQLRIHVVLTVILTVTHRTLVQIPCRLYMDRIRNMNDSFDGYPANIR